jgi:hypothetical protein
MIKECPDMPLTGALREVMMISLSAPGRADVSELDHADIE